MADTTILVEIKSDGNGARVIKRDLDEIAGKAEKTTKGVNGLKSAFIGLASALSIGAFTRFADSITSLNTKLNNISSNADEATRSFNALFQIAQKNGDSVSSLVDTFSKLNIVLPDALKETTDLVKVTDLLSRGLAATGADAQTARGALLQLSQGLASNFQASAQEINSLIDGAPLLAKVIAEELGGKSAVDLKRFAEAGTLTAESFLNALTSAEESIKAFDIPPTIGRSVERISNEFVRLGKESDILKGASGILATALDSLAASLDNIIKLVTVLAVTSLPTLIGLFARTLPAALLSTTAAFTALTVAMKANPFIAVTSAILAAVSAIFTFRKEISEALKGVNVFGKDASDIFASMGTLIQGTFAGIVAVIKKSIAELEVLLFRVSDSIARTSIGRRLGIEAYVPSASTVATSQTSIADLIARSTNQVATRRFQELNRVTNDIGLTQSSTPSTGTPPIIETLDEAKKKVKDLTKEVENPLTKSFENLESDIKSAFKDGFKDGEGFLNRFLSGAKSSFTDFIAEIAYMASKPIFLNLVGGLAGVGGATGANAIAGGGGGLGSITSSLRSVSSLLNGSGGNFINSIGGRLGFYNPIPSVGTMGPVAPTGLFGSTTLGGALSGGAIGGTLANFLGLGSGNMIQDTVFGGAGTAIGALFGGPLGAGVGSFLGTALGGLFGGKKPSDKSQFSIVDLVSGDIERTGLTGKKFSQENRDFADRVADEANSLAEILKEAGATLEGALTIIVGNRDGLRVNGLNFGTDSTAFIQGVTQAVLDSVADAPEDLASVLRNTAGFDTAELAEALGILELIRSFENAGNAARPLGDALDELDRQFKELRDKTIGLGLPADKLTESYEKQKDALIKNVLSPLQNFLDQQALGGDSSLNPTQRLSLARSAFDENLAAIRGGDFTNLNQITNQASQLLSIGRDIFASGEGFTALESFVRQSISGIAGDLGAEGGLNDSIAREITLSNAQQISIQQQMLIELQETRAENTRLRKAMERVGNSLVLQS